MMQVKRLIELLSLADEKTDVTVTDEFDGEDAVRYASVIGVTIFENGTVDIIFNADK